MFARIYQPARSATQSGQAKTNTWVLEFAPEEARTLDPLMGWTGSADTQRQVKLTFATKEAAVAHAVKHNVPYQVSEPKKRAHILRKSGYGDNFSHDRRAVWTH